MKDFIAYIIPPRKGDQDGLHRWSWAVFVWLVVGALAMLWMAGMFASYGFNGFARADELMATKRELKTEMEDVSKKLDVAAEQAKRERLDQLQTSILDTRLKQCAADTPLLRGMYGDQLQRKIAEYTTITGREYQLLPCSELK